MRVAMVSEHASPLAVLGGVDAGGQNVHVAELSRALARHEVDIEVYTRRDDRMGPRRTRFAPRVHVVHVDAGPPEELLKDDLLPYMDEFAEVLARAWQREPPDVVHAHFWMSGLAALRAARPLGIPVVQTFHALGTVKRRHQGDKDTSPPERLEIERWILRRAARVLASCTDEVFELLRIGADRRRLNVVPSGVDLTCFTPDGPRLRRRAGMHRIVTVGRLVERKGVGNVISALAHLPDTELIVAGGPARSRLEGDPEARRLLALAARRGVSERVTLCGRLSRDHVARLLRSADAVVSVPWYEPFGIVPVEAMACGAPVVASAVGGMVDTVVDGVTGVLVPPRDPGRLAESLRALLAEPERREAYGRAGAERARKRYDWDRIASSALEVYSSLGRRRSGHHARAGIARHGSLGPPPLQEARQHLLALTDALDQLEQQAERVEAWGERLARRLLGGGRLLTAGNGGSAAQAQHLTAELVGRYQTERCPLSAICLHADTSSYTAIGNDYGAEQAFARQVRAHGRRGDVLIALSTSGESPNVLAAVRAARETGMETWALCGARSSTLGQIADEALCAEECSPATVQEVHMVAIHLLCGAVDHEVALAERRRSARRRPERVVA